ncbi:mitogen-activated protein kinase [Pycnococcus provasolii]
MLPTSGQQGMGAAGAAAAAGGGNHTASMSAMITNSGTPAGGGALGGGGGGNLGGGAFGGNLRHDHGNGALLQQHNSNGLGGGKHGGSLGNGMDDMVDDSVHASGHSQQQQHPRNAVQEDDDIVDEEGHHPVPTQQQEQHDTVGNAAQHRDAAVQELAQAAEDAAAQQPSSSGSEGTHHFMVCGHLFEVASTYMPIKPIGKGAYGVVCSAKDVHTDERFAIKKIGNAFDNPVDAKRTLREIKLLRHLKHENVIGLRDIMKPPDEFTYSDVYLVYELMDTDLHQIIRSSQPLSDDHCQYFLYQLLRGLKYIHSANVLHRDLKPSNLLLNANCDLKICDFGLARTSSEREYMTEYVVTRWYRAPELLLSCSEYTSAIDIWSSGCIFAELLGRKPLFPGRDYVHQLNLVTTVIGSPTEAQMAFITSDKARRYISSLPTTQRSDMAAYYPHASHEAIALLSSMLLFDPSERVTVESALKSPYLASLHDEVDEPTCPVPFSFDFEDSALADENFIRAQVWKQITRFHPNS